MLDVNLQDVRAAVMAANPIRIIVGGGRNESGFSVAQLILVYAEFEVTGRNPVGVIYIVKCLLGKFDHANH